MKTKIIIIISVILLVLLSFAGIRMYSGNSSMKFLVELNANALADGNSVGTTIIDRDPNYTIRCTCQRVSGGGYRCLVEGFLGFLKGRCNQPQDIVCNDDAHNNNCAK